MERAVINTDGDERFADRIMDISRSSVGIQVTIYENNVRALNGRSEVIEVTPRTRAAAERLRECCSIPDHLVFESVHRKVGVSIYSWRAPKRS